MCILHDYHACSLFDVQAGASFAFAKATEGLDYVDTSFAANRDGMRAHDFSPRGYYHFGHPGESAASQAAHFCKTVGALHSEEVAVLDIETSDKMKPADVAKWSKEFVDHVMSTLGLPASRVVVCESSHAFLYPPLSFWKCSSRLTSVQTRAHGSGILKLEAAVCYQHILCGSAATPKSPLCRRAGQLGLFGNTLTKKAFPASLAIVTAASRNKSQRRASCFTSKL